MWKKYKFELNFKRLRGQRRRAKDDAKKSETGQIISDGMLTILLTQILF